ncbi:hypothetical protein EV359DRAFT_61894 [Lentinula novae-zelandiae]|nr:hypothetical protein EV359DRAFT_61894 [Lentinula novae-zelandiae]
MLGGPHGTESLARVLPGAAEIPKVTLVSRTQVSLNVRKDTGNRDPQLTATATPIPSSDDAKPNTTSDPLQVAAQQYPWIYMASTLDACFEDAEEVAEKNIQARSEELDKQEASSSDQRTRSEAERLIEFYGELSSDKFAKDAPKIMQNFLSHGDACTDIETEALRIASQDLNHIDFDTMDIMGPLREYNDVLDRLGTLQMEAFELESAMLRLTVSTTTTTESSSSNQTTSTTIIPSEYPAPPESGLSSAGPETNDNTSNVSSTTLQSAAARSQIAPIFAACLPIIHARGRNIVMAQQLVEGAKQNLSMTVHLQSLGIGEDDNDRDYDDEEEEDALSSLTHADMLPERCPRPRDLPPLSLDQTADSEMRTFQRTHFEFSGTVPILFGLFNRAFSVAGAQIVDEEAKVMLFESGVVAQGINEVKLRTFRAILLPGDSNGSEEPTKSGTEVKETVWGTSPFGLSLLLKFLAPWIAFALQRKWTTRNKIHLSV